MAAMSSNRLLFTLLYLCYMLLLIHVHHATSLAFRFDFSKPGSYCTPGSEIACAGDAYPYAHVIELTKTDISDRNLRSIGRVWYARPVPLWNNSTGELASFRTTFSFQIKPVNLDFSADGMAFFLGHYPSGIPHRSYGGNLGLFNGRSNNNATGTARIVAVEFDTYMNKEWDKDGNHVGINVNSIVSVVATSPDKNLTSGTTMTAEISYDNSTEILAVTLWINGTSYRVNASVDMRRCLPEEVAVGFSAATGSSIEVHRVLSWSFNSTLTWMDSSIISPGTAPVPPEIVSSKPIMSPGAAPVPTETVSSQSQDQMKSLTEIVRLNLTKLNLRKVLAPEGIITVNLLMRRVTLLQIDGQERLVAIKKFSPDSSAEGRKEFEAEIKIISRLRHRNLVQLIGWCDSCTGLLIVYELVSEGSLDKHIYKNERFLTWAERYKIIIGLGSALHYLHQEWEQCVVHGDIKPSNIMLGSSYNTKLGDFGLARLVDHGAKSRTTKVVLGTAGYIDPELINTRRPSTESDVYSFGIVLLEIVSGRRPVEEPDDSDDLFVLSRWVWDLYTARTPSSRRWTRGSGAAMATTSGRWRACSSSGCGARTLTGPNGRPWRRLCTPCSRRRQGCRLFGRRCTRLSHFLPWESMGTAICLLAPLPAPVPVEATLQLLAALPMQSQLNCKRRKCRLCFETIATMLSSGTRWHRYRVCLEDVSRMLAFRPKGCAERIE